MRIPRALRSGAAEFVAPDTTLLRVHFRTSLDLLVTLAVTLIAIGLSIGYQVLGRRGSREAHRDH